MKHTIKRWFSLLLALTMLVSFAQIAAQGGAETTAPFLLRFATASDAADYLRHDRDAAAIDAQGTCVAADLTAREAAAMRRSDAVQAVEADVCVHANGDADAAGEAEILPWSADAVGADAAHAQGLHGKGVRVAVLDSGLDLYSEIEPAGVVDLVETENANGDDMTGHGTAVAGILAAPCDGSGIVGIADAADVYIVRVLDAHNEAPLSRILRALDWCIEQDMDVVNMSFGTTQYSALLHNQIRRAADAGVLLVASAGNGETTEYPARFADVLSVSSVTRDMEPAQAAAAELAAPGECVYSASLLGGYAVCSGSSMASPHAAGAAAVLLSKDPDASPDMLRALLTASAKTGGILDLDYALTLYDDFARQYTSPSYIPQPNPMPAEEAETADAYVTGAWSASGHDGLADNYYGSASHNIRFPLLVKRVSATMDDQMSSDKLLHAVSNYVASAELLFEIARNYKTQGVSEFTHMNYRRSIASVLGTSEYDTLMNDITRALSIFSANTTAVDNADRQLGATNFTSVSEKTSTIVYGMFFHLLGDIYAHRTVVPPQSVQVTTSTAHGSGAGGNDGLYFVQSDFITDCGAHTGEGGGDVSALYSTKLSQLWNEIFTSEGIMILIAVVKWFGFLLLGRFLLSLQGAGGSSDTQAQLDAALLQSAVNLPSNAANGRMCRSRSTCCGAIMRLAGMGVLQFKDIKYALNGIEEYNANGTRSAALRTNWNYYEDQAPSNVFYNRRYVLAKAVTKHYFEDFYASVRGGEIREFSPYYLLSEPYGESVRKQSHSLTLN